MLSKLQYYVRRDYHPDTVWPLYRGFMSREAFTKLWHDAMASVTLGE